MEQWHLVSHELLSLSRNKLISIFVYSQNSGNGNEWDGFESNHKKSQSTYSTTSSATTKTQKANSSKQNSLDFTSLDVKAMPPKPVTSKSKNIEDDAWKMLNEWKPLSGGKCFKS